MKLVSYITTALAGIASLNAYTPEFKCITVVKGINAQGPNGVNISGNMGSAEFNNYNNPIRATEQHWYEPYSYDLLFPDGSVYLNKYVARSDCKRTRERHSGATIVCEDPERCDYGARADLDLWRAVPMTDREWERYKADNQNPCNTTLDEIRNGGEVEEVCQYRPENGVCPPGISSGDIITVKTLTQDINFTSVC